MNLQEIVLSEKSQSPKVTLCIIQCMWYFLNKKILGIEGRVAIATEKKWGWRGGWEEGGCGYKSTAWPGHPWRSSG